MLHNPKFQGVSLRRFTAWLETKQANERYSFVLPTECAVAQYLQSRGKSLADSVVNFTADGAWLKGIVETAPHTFGAALKRARAVA